ncbi:MAG: hypothetical protein AB7U39_24560 [Ilumatobacteraceae bacterium]
MKDSAVDCRRDLLELRSEELFPGRPFRPLGSIDVVRGNPEDQTSEDLVLRPYGLLATISMVEVHLPG